MTASRHPDPEIRELSNKLLREAGYTTDTANTSAEAPSPTRKLILAFSFFSVLLVFSAAIAFNSYYTIKNIEWEDVATAKRFTGIATVSDGRSGWLTIKEQGNIVVSCSFRQCGFPGMQSLSGQEVEVRIGDDFVLEATANGVLIDAKKLRLEMEESFLRGSLYLMAVFAAAILFLLARYWAHIKRRFFRHSPPSNAKAKEDPRS